MIAYLKRQWRDEPARFVTRTLAFVQAALGLGVVFGVELSQAQQSGILTTIATLAAVFLGGGEAIRSQVVTMTKHEEVLDGVKKIRLDAPPPRAGRNRPGR